MEVKKALEADLPDGEKLKLQAVVKELASRWKALTDKEKADWNVKASRGLPPSGDGRDSKMLDGIELALVKMCGLSRMSLW